MMREPYWRTANERDWGLKRATWKDWVVASVEIAKQLKDPLTHFYFKNKIKESLCQEGCPCISLGSGKETPKGWVGFDRYRSGKNVFPVNLLLPLPVESDFVEAILAEHILEHFYFDDVFWILKECHRVLSPGGKLRIICPDAENVARLVLDGTEAEKDYDVKNDSRIHRWPEDGLLWARTVNRLSHQWGQHKSLLTAKMVKQLLEKADFREIHMLSVDRSVLFDTLPDIHQRRFPDDSLNMSFAVEAIAQKKGE